MAKTSGLILRYVFIFAVFCGAAGLLLQSLHDLVEPRRAAYQQRLETKSLRLLAPGAEVFNPAAAGGQNYYLAYAADGQLRGYVLKTAVWGYSSDLEMLIGLNEKFDITGFLVLAQAETPGLGAKLTEPEFAAKLEGQSAVTLKLRQDGGTVDAITGATITSRAAVRGINQAVDALQEALAGK